MKVAQQVEQILKRLRYGIVYDYTLFDAIENRNTLYVTINRLIKAQKIKRFSKGKFFKVKSLAIEAFGLKRETTTRLNNQSKWKQILGEGVITGPALYNGKGLTTQNAFTIEVSQYNARRRTKKIALETISYKPLPIKPTPQNKAIIELIDIVANKRRIQDIDEKAFTYFVAKELKITQEDTITQTLSFFPLQTQRLFIQNATPINREKTRSIEQKILKPYQRQNNELA